MEIEFKSKKLRKTCENYIKLCEKDGDKRARKIVQRINELIAASNLFDISMIPNARLHPLKQNRKGQLAVDIDHPYRMILEPANGDIQDYQTITKVIIIEFIDYH